MIFKKIHRVLGLFMADFWLVQALTGVLLTFRQELDNATLPGHGASFARSFYDTLYPLHTGELGGLAGRLLLLVLGVALLVMGVYGIRLWLARRKPRQRPV